VTRVVAAVAEEVSGLTAFRVDMSNVKITRPIDQIFIDE
jgi:hypothetical protein